MSDEPVESAQPRETSFAARILCCVWAAVVSEIPALAAIYSALQITRFFSSMKNAEDATTSSVFAQLHILNTPMVIALGVSVSILDVAELSYGSWMGKQGDCRSNRGRGITPEASFQS